MGREKIREHQTPVQLSKTNWLEETGDRLKMRNSYQETNWRENTTTTRNSHHEPARLNLETNQREQQKENRDKKKALTRRDISQATANMKGRQTDNKGTTGKDTEITEENILALIDFLEVMKKVDEDRAERALKIQKNKYVKQ